MYKLDDVKDYFHTKLGMKGHDSRIQELYNMISNSKVRANDPDKKWVAYVTQASEDKTAVDAIITIMKDKYPSWERPSEDKVIEAVNETGKLFEKHKIDMKPRIPFYISVLDKLV